MDGIVVAVGDVDMDVKIAMTFVFATTGVSINWVFAQEARISSRKELTINLIEIPVMAKEYSDEVIFNL